MAAVRKKTYADQAVPVLPIYGTRHQIRTRCAASVYPNDESKQMKMTRFWFTFNLTMRDPHPPGVLMGCGITALDEEDAVRILKENVFRAHPFPGIKAMMTDVDVSKLDQGHVLPNMGDPTSRGAWFPLGYS